MIAIDNFELAYVEGFESDFNDLDLNEDEFEQLDRKLAQLCQSNPRLQSERVMNRPYRRIKFHDSRVFLYISEQNRTVYVLSIRRRKDCYDPKALSRVEKRLTAALGK